MKNIKAKTLIEVEGAILTSEALGKLKEILTKNTKLL